MVYKNIELITAKILTELGINSPEEIKVEKIAEYYNIDVQAAELDYNISGFFVMKENKPFIRYNGSESKQRRNFTIAHEIGHFILHKEVPLFVDKNEAVLFRNDKTTTGAVIKEREANAFAASLLMPQHFIESEIAKVPNGFEIIPVLAEKFDVSTTAMSFRLSNLGYDFGMF